MSRSSKHRRQTVLVVEDDEWLRGIVAELLRDEGYGVSEADSGVDALRLVERGGPAVLVLDLHLPQCSGLDVLRALRAAERTVNLPVIVVSGLLDFETRARLVGRAERADCVLEKPLDVERLFDEVHHLAGPPPPSGDAVGWSPAAA